MIFLFISVVTILVYLSLIIYYTHTTDPNCQCEAFRTRVRRSGRLGNKGNKGRKTHPKILFNYMKYSMYFLMPYTLLNVLALTTSIFDFRFTFVLVTILLLMLLIHMVLFLLFYINVVNAKEGCDCFEGKMFDAVSIFTLIFFLLYVLGIGLILLFLKQRLSS